MKRRHKLRVVTILVFAAISVAGCKSQNQVATNEIAETSQQVIGAVRAVLDEQVEAWNRGDIEGFMKGYLKSDETTFISGDTVTRGWQTVLDRYKKNYDSREKMGKLAFSELEVKSLSDDTALVNGRYQLTRASDMPHGRFTLILKRMPDGWRITHDHTSAAGS